MLLVSGVVDNTAGAVLKRSQGRVLAQTERELEVRIPLQETRLLPTGRSVYRPTLHLFGLYIPLYTDGKVEGDYALTVRRHPSSLIRPSSPWAITRKSIRCCRPRK